MLHGLTCFVFWVSPDFDVTLSNVNACLLRLPVSCFPFIWFPAYIIAALPFVKAVFIANETLVRVLLCSVLSCSTLFVNDISFISPIVFEVKFNGLVRW